MWDRIQALRLSILSLVRALGRRGTAAFQAARPPVEAAAQHALEAYRSLFKGLEPGANLGLAIVVISLLWGLISYLVLTGHTDIVPRQSVVVSVLSVNVILILIMIALIGWQVRGIVRAWKRQVPGARLHARIVLLFSGIAALPAILLTLAATDTFSRSFDTFLNTRARQIVENSLEIANAYMDEHGKALRTDAVNMAHDLDAAPDLEDNPSRLHDLVVAQASLRDIPFAYLIDHDGRILVAGIEDAKIPFKAPSPTVFAEADGGQTPLMLSAQAYRVAALAKLNRPAGSYLLVARGMAPEVIGHLKRTAEGVAEFQELRARRGGTTVAQALIYFTIALTAIMAAIWAGLWFASRFVAPIRRLIAAAQEVSRGNLKVALPLKRGEGDLRRLSQTFNTMTTELKTQRDALVAANDQLIERRRFMEAVLSGVSAGVLGLDDKGVIKLANRSAETLLGASAESLVGKPLVVIVPEFARLLEESTEPRLKGRPQDQLTLPINGEDRTFAVRITHEQSGDDPEGAVVTFDDVTELVSAQRTSAWGDVARRIAHEIKNPLTPIQLSAERIRRKYGKVIVEDKETFNKLTETIERQAGHIKSMVDEFAAFARMPKPQMELEDLREAVLEAVVLFRESHQQIEFRSVSPKDPILMKLDRRLLSQAATNIVKNATEAIQQVAESADCPAGYKGLIETRLAIEDGRAIFEVIDNGIGLQKQNRARLIEPYVTTKAKGTGLGLSIVQKIVEQHGGVITLEDAPLAPGRTRGALVRLTLPLTRGATQAQPAQPAKPAAAE